jgi:hypothetical protein
MSCPHVLELQLQVPSNDKHSYAWNGVCNFGLNSQINADFPELRRIKSQWVAIAKNAWDNCYQLHRRLVNAHQTPRCPSLSCWWRRWHQIR